MSHPPSRRQFLQLLGGAAGVGLLPLNFAAGCGKPALVIGSYFRPTPEAHALGLCLLGLDGYPVHYPLDAARADEPMLAWALAGEALSPEHGAPVRALFPGRHGMFSPKWLDSLTLTREQPTYDALAGV